MTDENAFLPDDYEVPSDNKYLRITNGEHRIRILSSPVMGWLDWKDKKPMRFHMDACPEKPVDPQKPIKHFWAMVVWNYEAEKIQILELTQKSVMNAIKSLAKNPNWGNPSKYDLCITRSGSGREGTKYETMPVPPSAVDAGIEEMYLLTGVNLEALFSNGDPFAAAVKS